MNRLSSPLLATILIFLFALPLSAQTDDWTILVYLAADNNLDWYFNADNDDISEMSSSFESSYNYNVVVQWDEYGNNNSRRIEITEGSYTTVQDLGEVNMGDDETLSDFVEWGIDNYPADHYFVITWDHGDGWYRDPEPPPIRAVCGDDQSGGDYIGIAGGEWRTALQSIYNHLGRKIDIWGHDACLMGMIEVYYEANSYCDYFVGSEETEPIDGWPYDDILDWLNTQGGNPSPSAFAAMTAELYVDSYSPGGSAGSAPDPVAMGAIALGTPVTQLVNALDQFALRLSNYGGRDLSPIPTHRDNSQEYYDPDHIDLYDFADRICNDGSFPSYLTSAAGDVCTQLTAATIYSGYYSSTMNGSHGSAIYYPEGSTSGSYNSGNLLILAATYWDEYQNGSTIPVELVSLEAAVVEEGVSLRWETASESDNLGFTVYRQTEGVNDRIALNAELIPGGGTTNEGRLYEFVDHSPVEGPNAYWLEQIDFSGSSELFGPVEVFVPFGDLRLELAGSNPISGDASLRWSVPAGSGNPSLGLYDLSGRLALTIPSNQETSNSFSLSDIALPDGVYLAILKTDTSRKTIPLVFSR